VAVPDVVEPVEVRVPPAAAPIEAPDAQAAAGAAEGRAPEVDEALRLPLVGDELGVLEEEVEEHGPVDRLSLQLLLQLVTADALAVHLARVEVEVDELLDVVCGADLDLPLHAGGNLVLLLGDLEVAGALRGDVEVDLVLEEVGRGETLLVVGELRELGLDLLASAVLRDELEIQHDFVLVVLRIHHDVIRPSPPLPLAKTKGPHAFASGPNVLCGG